MQRGVQRMVQRMVLRMVQHMVQRMAQRMVQRMVQRMGQRVVQRMVQHSGDVERQLICQWAERKPEAKGIQKQQKVVKEGGAGWPVRCGAVAECVEK